MKRIAVLTGLLATRFGVAAVEQLVTGPYGVLIGLLKGEIATTPLATVISKRKALDTQLLKMAQILAR